MSVPGRRKLTVPQLAKSWGVSANKILAFIKNGELRAVNLALSRAGRPRYAIDNDDIATFEASRVVIPEVGGRGERKRSRSSKKGIKEFF